MKNRIFNILQRVGKSFMVPIAVLPIAGIFLAIAMALTNETMIAKLGLESLLGTGTLINALMTILKNVGEAIFDNLPLIFAAGVALGMAHKEKEVAVLSAILAYLVMHVTIHSMLVLNGQILGDGTFSKSVLEGTIVSVCGISTLEIGVFGGIVVGLGVAYLHNHFYRIELPSIISFFGGIRFIPIISTLVFIGVGILLYYIWPVIQGGIYTLGGFVTGTGYFGTLVFGMIKRLLVPFGLHHVFYLPFWQTAVGGSVVVNGTLVHGGQNIFFAQLADPNLVHFSAEATRYFTGEFIFMIFGLPGAALAMYHCAKSKKRKQISSLLLTAALTSVLTGITEPIEFTFIFVAPILYGIQVVLAGSAYMVAHILNITVGLTFSGGLIDFILFGVMQGNDKTNWVMMIPVGIIYFVLYYLVFKYIIIKYDLKTIGRGDDEQLDEVQKSIPISTEQSDDKQSSYLLKGLGGKDNFKGLDCCVTRLRTTVIDPTKLNNGLLKQSGAAGIIKQGNSVQIVYGPRASIIKAKLEEYIDKLPEIALEPVEEVVSSMALTNIVAGEVKDIDCSSDELFSSKVMGDGVVVVPEENIIVAPCKAKVTMIFPTKHALGLMLENGCEILLHFGVNTVKLNGAGFSVLVEENQEVDVGTPLWEVDLQYIKEHAISEEIMLVFTSMPAGVKLIKLLGKRDRGEVVLLLD